MGAWKALRQSVDQCWKQYSGVERDLQQQAMLLPAGKAPAHCDEGQSARHGPHVSWASPPLCNMDTRLRAQVDPDGEQSLAWCTATLQ